MQRKSTMLEHKREGGGDDSFIDLFRVTGWNGSSQSSNAAHTNGGLSQQEASAKARRNQAGGEGWQDTPSRATRQT